MSAAFDAPVVSLTQNLSIISTGIPTGPYYGLAQNLDVIDFIFTILHGGSFVSWRQNSIKEVG